MPTVTVTLKHTPKPEGEAVAVCEGMRVYRHGDSVFILDEGSGPYGTDQHIEVPIAGALALARALALVAGCVDPRWRGHHWEARERNGELLGETPAGEWYGKREDCEQAVRTLFGDRSEVVMGPGYPMPGGAMVLVLREPTPAAAITNADDTPEAEQ